MDTTVFIQQLNVEINRLTSARNLLSQLDSGAEVGLVNLQAAASANPAGTLKPTGAKRGRPAKLVMVSSITPKTTRRPMSPEAKKRIGDAVRLRHAKNKKTAAKNL